MPKPPLGSACHSATTTDTSTPLAGRTVPEPEWDHRFNGGGTHSTDALAIDQNHTRGPGRMCLGGSIDGIRKTASNFLHRISDRLRRALRSSFRRNSSSNVSDLSAGASIDLPDCWGNFTEVDTKDVSSDRDQSLTASAINTVPARYVFGRTRNNTRTSTPPEICLWLSTFLIGQETDWIIRHSTRSANKHLVRTASCLQRAHRHLYDVPEEDYPDLQFPLGATGHKPRYHTHAMAPKRPTYPRGAKGLKRAGDADVPSTRWAPNGTKLQPFDYQMFKLRGYFFPAPSNLRHVETLSYETELEIASEHHDPSLSGLPAVLGQSHQHLSNRDTDQQKITSQPIAGEVPTDYYGPARNYAGSVSSSSDSLSDSDDLQNHAGAFATEIEAHDADSMSIDLPDPDPNSEVHYDEKFGVFHGQDDPQVRLSPASIAQVSDIMYAADDGLDHDEVRSYRHLSLLPPLPEGYRYLVTPTMAFCRKPYLIVPVRPGHFGDKEQRN